MPPLLVIAGLSDVLQADVAQALGTRLPELPGLSELLRLGDPTGADSDWRSGLLRDLGAGELAAAAPATIAATGLALRPGDAVCLATPVHAVAGMSRVHLHAAGPLQLDAVHSAAFAAAFAAQFGAELRLHAAGDGWLIEAACAVAAGDADPLTMLGAPLERDLARSAAQRQLRHLGAEIEMWLASLPLNAERARRGELPVNLLWMWGGGRMPSEALRLRVPLRLHAAHADPWLMGCAALAGVGLLPLPEAWGAVSQPQEATIVLGAGPVTDGGQLRDWEERWFQPLLHDLRTQRIAEVRLRLGRHSLRVRRRFWSAPWRRSRPWWQAVVA